MGHMGFCFVSFEKNNIVVYFCFPPVVFKGRDFTTGNRLGFLSRGVFCIGMCLLHRIV